MEKNEKKGTVFANNFLVKAIGPQKLIVILVIALLALMFSLMSPAFRQYSTVVSIFDYSYYISLMAIGVTFPLITGGVDLSIGTGMVSAGLIGGYFVTFKEMPVVVGMVAAILFGLILGGMNAFLVAKMELPPFISTLGTMMIARGMGSIVTGGMAATWPPATDPRGWFRSLFKLSVGGMNIPIGFIIVLFAVVIMSVLLNKTRPGRYITAIGSNKEAARLSGINVIKYQSLAYLISGLFTGFAGIAYAGTFQTIAPGTGAGLELDAIAGAIIGGTSMSGGYGTVTGTLLGVFVMSLLKTGLPFIGLQANWQQIVTGIVLIVAVLIDVLKNSKRS